MTDSQIRALQVRAARNAQKYRRALETQVNKLETVLNRLIKAKTRVTAERYGLLFSQWDAVKSAFIATEKAITDTQVLE